MRRAVNKTGQDCMELYRILCFIFISAKEVCSRRCWFVCLLATLHQNFQTDFQNISGKVGNGLKNSWLNFGDDPDPDPYPELLIRSLAEVCIVPVLLVVHILTLHIFHHINYIGWPNALPIMSLRSQTWITSWESIPLTTEPWLLLTLRSTDLLLHHKQSQL